MSRRALAAGAIRRAATLRARLGYGPADAVCPFDIAERIGLEVRLIAVPSLEGMYSPEGPAAVVNALRPAGRRRYTCGHELGHHEHGHGASFDAGGELAADRAEEFVANQFSRALLMPKLAVASAFVRRGWSPALPTAEQVFVVAQDLGVGFTTLVDQMSGTLNLIDRPTADCITKVRLPKLRSAILPRGAEHDLFPVDRHWGVRPLDLEVGDIVLAPRGSRADGVCVQPHDEELHAARAGEGRLYVPERSAPVRIRVARRGFVGRAIYRNLEDVDDE